MWEIIGLAIAGGIGAVGRYAISGWTHRLFGTRFAYGTLVVNVLGCFLLALLMEAALDANVVPRSLRIPLSVGLLGAFTTFSTFGYETIRYFEDGAAILALTNVAANIILCLAATWSGLITARSIWGGV